jgi:hypothetical protein
MHLRALHNAETVTWKPAKAPAAHTGLPLDLFWFDGDYDKHHPESPLRWLWLLGSITNRGLRMTFVNDHPMRSQLTGQTKRLSVLGHSSELR